MAALLARYAMAGSFGWKPGMQWLLIASMHLIPGQSTTARHYSYPHRNVLARFSRSV